MNGSFLEKMEKKALANEALTKDEALRLVNAQRANAENADTEKTAAPAADALAAAADRIARHYHGDRFDLCAVTSVKGGRCSENCAFCPQSRISSAEINCFSFRSPEEIVRAAKARACPPGVRRFGLVSVGRQPTGREVAIACEAVRRIRSETSLLPCVSLGLLRPGQLAQLKEAGVVRLHNNLETSRGFFPRVCTSHAYDEKIAVIRAAKELGFEICSGGLFGMGESWEDRVDLALTLRELGVDSVPVNLLNPAAGTPLAGRSPLPPEEAVRIAALFRFLIPNARIRLAAGRPYLPDTGLSVFRSGANASITGDMLTVKGISMEEDLRNIRSLGFTL